MAFATSGVVQATDYNTISTQLANIYGSGYGPAGLGQSTSAFSTVALGNTVAATQWTGLIQSANSALAHQGGTAISPASVVTGGVITAYSTITTGLNSAIANGGGSNLLLWSQDFTYAGWNKSSTTNTPNTTVAPDSTTTASTWTTPTGYNPVSANSITSLANTLHTMSGYFKAGTSNVIQLAFGSVGLINEVWGSFDLSTGAASGANYAGSASSGSTSIVSVGNGWYRCSVSGIIDAITTAYRIDYFNNTQANTTVYAWGCQFEKSPFAGAYVVTGNLPKYLGGTTALALNDSAATNATYTGAWGNSGNRGLIFTHTVTFTSADAARYFFNAGGKLKLSFSRTGGSATTRNTEMTALATDCGVWQIRHSAVAKVGGGGQPPTINLGNYGGYWNFTGSDVAQIVQYDGIATYSTNYIVMYARWGGISGNGGYNTIVITTYFINTWSNAFQDTVDGTSTAALIVSSPSTTYVNNTWGTPTVTPTAALY